MTKPKFTPGPWLTDFRGPESAGAYAILTDKGWGAGNPWIADVHGFNVGPLLPAETHANASLISAAPDMYAALEAVLSLPCFCWSSTGRGDHSEKCAIPRVLAALAKAGRQ
jgi:hypothetical protein